ncbi:uncharacterized protein HMPREF1541_09378 [Cyphellophora europaea CBS 101466]|uniref:NmrA-like domain-containing protein n=1 Tax=Cyphellophora europaea (strain CBS 101466) TaxID=1220924 RepID=W2S9Z4_CYPE1|nr:uncharacterized protein HMPREF1541_09378 [Cyphellophora europaea CBS 101466]ETN45546.1 hypothetical protein HMPREF1541_09378 [Cyphellophora europaea CBS 101466]
MSEYNATKIFVVGGTGAQGIPVIRGLVKDKKYACRVLTRDANSARAQQLLALGNVELVTGSFASEQDLRNGFRGCDGAFVNIDGFNCGEKTEIYWTIRAYELALEEGIRFYVHGNLDYTYKKSGYDPKFRTGHYDAKGRISEWILAQTKDNQHRMGAASFTTGPYIEMAIASRTIFTPVIEDGVVTWRVPLGERGGGVVHVALDDCEYYVRWMFDNPMRINGRDLEVAVEHVSYLELAKAFEKVTGHPARYINTSLADYWSTGIMAVAAKSASGYNSDLNDPAAMTFEQNFTGFFNTWKYSWGNNEQAVIKRDYKLLDEIHPERIKSVEEWFRIEEEKGKKLGKGGLWDRVQTANLRPILKLGEDGRRGRL